MKRLISILVIVTALPVFSAWAETKAKKPLPQVPVTYQEDTDKDILRRAQWVEAAKKEGAIDWWGTRKPDEGNKIIAEFNKIYPFIKVSYWRGQGEEVAAKLEAENAAGRSSADILMGGEPYNYPRWRKLGIMEKYVDIIPLLEKWDKGMYSKYGDWVQPGNSPKIPEYNTKLVSAAEAPKKWEDILHPKWKGQIALQTDMNMWVILALAEGGWGIEKTEQFLKKLKQQNPIWAAGGTAGHNLLIAGDYKMMVDADLRSYLQTQNKGVPIEWVRVNPIPVSGSAFTLLKKAPHPSAARLFLEWMLSPQGLVVYENATKLGAAFPGAGTRVAKTLEGMTIVNRTEEVSLKAVELHLSDRFANILGVSP